MNTRLLQRINAIIRDHASRRRAVIKSDSLAAACTFVSMLNTKIHMASTRDYLGKILTAFPTGEGKPLKWHKRHIHKFVKHEIIIDSMRNNVTGKGKSYDEFVSDVMRDLSSA